ncbi:hypothetical protein PESP_a0343 [Pseudoalteromonas espejiana DSM 9414]|nr:hypothetical protein PESP_a0343 [Pseudoalteromonas espejiana DSM 9414]
MRKNLNLIALKIAASCEDMVLKNLKTRVLRRVTFAGLNSFNSQRSHILGG